MKILLVEDNPVDRMFVAQSLRQVDGFDHELNHSETLAEALEQVAASQFDVILLDLWLPDCEGLETCQNLVAAARHIPVVVMTATDDRELATDIIRSGAQDYLVKGTFPGVAIVRVLQYAIERHHFQRELTHRDNHFQQVMSHVPAIIWTTDDAMQITGALGAELQFLKIDPRQVIGQTLEEYFRSTGDGDETIRSHQRALEGTSVAFETAWLGRDFEIKIDPLHEPERGVVGTIGVALDVTQRRSLDRELHFAHLVQQALLPSAHPTVEGFDIFGGSYSATQTCGDWFDYLTFPDGSVGLVVGDVSGHGFGPAILSATISAYLEALAESHSDIQEILCTCNRMVCRRCLDGEFAVLALGRLRSGIRSLIYGGAGDRALIVSRNGQLKHKVPAIGVPCGQFDEFPYDEPADVPLEPGDIVLMLTDGFREAFDPNDNQFGESRIVETVAAHSQTSACEIFNALWQAARNFADRRHQNDDMTGIVVKVLDA